VNLSRFEERSAGNLHATFCGSRRRVTASGDLVAVGQLAVLPSSVDLSYFGNAPVEVKRTTLSRPFTTGGFARIRDRGVR